MGEEVTSEERSDTETKAPASPESDREKILELIADIGSGSESMMANYQEGQVQRRKSIYCHVDGVLSFSAMVLGHVTTQSHDCLRYDMQQYEIYARSRLDL